MLLIPSFKDNRGQVAYYMTGDNYPDSKQQGLKNTQDHDSRSPGTKCMGILPQLRGKKRGHLASCQAKIRLA
jgi:hypothetical protein